MNETETPRTAAAWKKWIQGETVFPLRDECWALERELAETREKLAAELRSWNALTNEAADLRMALAVATKQRDALAHALRACEREMKNILADINAEVMPHDGDDFHEALLSAKTALSALNPDPSKKDKKDC